MVSICNFINAPYKLRMPTLMNTVWEPIVEFVRWCPYFEIEIFKISQYVFWSCSIIILIYIAPFFLGTPEIRIFSKSSLVY